MKTKLYFLSMFLSAIYGCCSGKYFSYYEPEYKGELNFKLIRNSELLKYTNSEKIFANYDGFVDEGTNYTNYPLSMKMALPDIPLDTNRTLSDNPLDTMWKLYRGDNYKKIKGYYYVFKILNYYFLLDNFYKHKIINSEFRPEVKYKKGKKDTIYYHYWNPSYIIALDTIKKEIIEFDDFILPQFDDNADIKETEDFTYITYLHEGSFRNTADTIFFNSAIILIQKDNPLNIHRRIFENQEILFIEQKDKNIRLITNSRELCYNPIIHWFRLFFAHNCWYFMEVTDDYFEYTLDKDLNILSKKEMKTDELKAVLKKRKMYGEK